MHLVAAHPADHQIPMFRPSDFHRVFLFSGMCGGECVAVAKVVPQEA